VLYKLKKLECEVCKEPLPSVLKIKDKKIPIFHIERPECPYVILQGFSKEKTNSKELYLIPILNNEPIKLVFLNLIIFMFKSNFIILFI